MNDSGDFRRVAIVGVGLIGGSIAFAARRRFPRATIVGIDRDDVVVPARQLGALHAGGATLDLVAGADLVILSAPVGQNLLVLPQLAALLHEPALVTDTGSTKRATIDAARALPAHLTFIGGHPLAGAARGGIEASRVDLFERRPWLLTPGPDTPRPAVERLAAFVRALGATPVEMDPVAHDRVLAYTSHLPQLTATALMHVVGEAVGAAGLQWSGAGLADTTRLATSPAAVWNDICHTNADEILPALDRLIDVLRAIRGQVAAQETIAPLFDSARRWRDRVR